MVISRPIAFGLINATIEMVGLLENDVRSVPAMSAVSECASHFNKPLHWIVFIHQLNPLFEHVCGYALDNPNNHPFICRSFQIKHTGQKISVVSVLQCSHRMNKTSLMVILHRLPLPIFQFALLKAPKQS